MCNNDKLVVKMKIGGIEQYHVVWVEKRIDY